MSVAQNMLSRKDILKTPQYVVEGHAAADYAKDLASPVMKNIGSMAYLDSDPQQEFIPFEYAGSFDPKGIVKNREKTMCTLSFRLHDTSVDFLKWCFNKPDGAGTPDESRTFIQSYKNVLGTEVFQIFRGCKVASATLNITKDQPVMLEVSMNCRSYFEKESVTTTGSGISGTPKWAPDINDDPLRFKDVGAFLYNISGAVSSGEFAGSNLAYRSLSLTCTWELVPQDSNGYEQDVYYDYGTRKITGNIEMFKKAQTFQNDAILGKQVPATLEVQKDPESGSNAQATVTIGTTNTVVVKSLLAGAAGNALSVQVIAGSTGTVTGVRVIDDKEIIIQLKSGGDTIKNIKDKINGHKIAKTLVVASTTGTDSTNMTAAKAKTNLASGDDKHDRFSFARFRFLPSSENLLEVSAATFENKSFEIDFAVFNEA